MLNVTTIKLYNDSLYPSQPTGGSLDCSDTTVIPLNFAISDIRDISKKKGVFSKSITLPSTKNNNKLLNNYFDINIQAGTFDINKLQKCAVVQDGVTILDNAILQLVSINKSQNNSTLEDSITYTVLIKDATSDFFTTISNKYLNNINMDDLNHVYTANNVISSFSNTVVNGYKYVMPYNQAYEDDANFELIEFTPAIYAKRYFDKIFSGAGYTYEWSSMTQSDFRFDKLVIPYNGDAVRTTSEESLFYSVTAHATMSTYISNTVIQQYEQNGYNDWYVMGPGYSIITLNIEDSDPSGSYSPITNLYTTPNLPSISNFVTYELLFNYSIDASSTPPPPGDYIFEVLLADLVYNPSYGDDIINTVYDSIVISAGPAQSGFITSGTRKIILRTSGLLPGIRLGIFGQLTTYGGGPGTSEPSYYGVEMSNVSVKIITSLDGDVSYNTPLKMNKFIPQNIKQSDFVKSILTMYNLYVEVDKTVNNKLIIRSRDEYYDSGVVRNWTKKLVKEKEQDIKFIPEITNKKAILTYKEDSDWANTQYKAATNEIYGQAEYIFDNEYVKDITKTELIFSPTPFFNNTFGAICPIWNGQGPKTNIRILYDAGTFSCGKYYIYNYGTASFATASYYPLISHWDKPTNPTFDLNFLPCDFYFRNDDWGSNTNNNLFNLHWRRTFNQINSGKLLSAYFTLTPYDISILKLNDKIRIDNSWWNINSIKDYDANSKGPTKVELISIDELLKIPFKTVITNKLLPSSPLFAFNEVLNNDLIRTKNFIRNKGTMKVSGRNNYVSNNVLSAEIIGNGNSVSTNSVVKGSDNVVNSKNAMVFGDNNKVSSSIKNSIIIGDNIVATQSNTLYTDNIIMSPSGTINGYNVINSVSLWEPNATGIGSVQQIVAPGSLPNTASGDNSTATGVRNNTSGVASFSSGYNNNSLGNYSSTLNNGNTATGQSSIASGANNNSVGNISSTFGNDNTANSVAETVIGTYAELVTGTPATFVATDTVFRVGIGQNTGARLDAFRVYKNSAIKLNPVTTASITTPVTGMVIFNSSNNALSYYDGTTWLQYIEVATLSTGTIIEFKIPLTYNSPSSPGTTNITNSLTGARIGIIQKIYHQNGTAPTFPAGWVLLRGSYSTTLLNIIYSEWVSGTRVEYWIIN